MIFLLYLYLYLYDIFVTFYFYLFTYWQSFNTEIRDTLCIFTYISSPAIAENVWPTLT